MKRADKIHRLTPFEEYMFLDDSPAYPMYSVQRLRFSGRIDPGVFTASLDDAVRRHPLLNARIAVRGGKYFWEPLETPPTVLRRTFGSGDEPPFSPPDITRQAGLLTFFDESLDAERKARTDMAFVVHHSASDAAGIMAFMEDVLLGCAKRLGAIPAEMPLPELNPESFSLRHNPGLSWRRYFKLFPWCLRTTWETVTHFPRPLLPVRPISADDSSAWLPTIRNFAFSAEETAALRSAAKNSGATLNDLLIRDLFLANERFMTKYLPKKRGRVRVAMPINMRPESHRNLFAANVVSMVFLDRRRGRIDASEKFFNGIKRETRWIKEKDQGLVLLENLNGRRSLPGGIQMELRHGRCWATSVLSNLGVIFAGSALPKTPDGRLRLGDAVMEEYLGVPPMRYKTLTSWGVWTYAGRLHCAVCCDGRFLSPEQIDETIRFFQEQVTAH